MDKIKKATSPILANIEDFIEARLLELFVEIQSKIINDDQRKLYDHDLSQKIALDTFRLNIDQQTPAANAAYTAVIVYISTIEPYGANNKDILLSALAVLDEKIIALYQENDQNIEILLGRKEFLAQLGKISDNAPYR